MLLVGAGSHAARLVALFQLPISAYVSDKSANWMGWTPPPRIENDDEALARRPGPFVLGIGGVRPEQLQARLALARRYCGRGWIAQTMNHLSGFTDESARLGHGVHVMNGAQISSQVVIKEHALINAGAIVEHHSVIGAGSHIAPGAVILGNVVIGECCMIGANATIIEGTKVSDGTMVKANTVWKGAAPVQLRRVG